VPTDVLADRLGSTRGAIYKTLHDARRKLRARLAGDGLAVTSAAVEPSTARVRTSFEVAAVGELGAGRRELTGLSIGTRARRRLHRPPPTSGAAANRAAAATNRMGAR
jgi:hypothetical protein